MLGVLLHYYGNIKQTSDVNPKRDVLDELTISMWKGHFFMIYALPYNKVY